MCAFVCARHGDILCARARLCAGAKKKLVRARACVLAPARSCQPLWARAYVVFSACRARVWRLRARVCACCQTGHRPEGFSSRLLRVGLFNLSRVMIPVVNYVMWTPENVRPKAGRDTFTLRKAVAVNVRARRAQTASRSVVGRKSDKFIFS